MKSDVVPLFCAPMIRAEGRGYTFTVFFYGCTENRDCTTLGFNSYFADGTSDIAKVNGWNRENRFGRAYVDGDGDAGNGERQRAKQSERGHRIPLH